MMINSKTKTMITEIKNGQLIYEGKAIPCLTGKNGFTLNKKEGDMMSPIGSFSLEPVIYYRSDAVDLSKVNISPVFRKVPITRDMGWCDDPEDRENYNQLIKLPHSSSHELMWREDEAYNIVIPVSHNTKERIPGQGSAIFLHCTRPDMKYTAGCIAMSEHDFLEYLQVISAKTTIEISL